MQNDTDRYDVAISDEFPIAAKSCADTIRLSGLAPIIMSMADIVQSSHAAYVIASDHDGGDDIHVVRVLSDTEDAGRAAAYEVLAELFDDSEPGDEI